METKILEAIQKDQIKKRPEVRVGDTLRLHMKIREGEKERVQIFEGILIAVKGTDLNKTITVRKISGGVGVERIVPMHAPTLDKVEVVKRGGNIRKAKMYFMRDRVGKLAMKIKGSEYIDMQVDEAVEEAPTEVADEVVTPVEEVVAEAPVEDVKAEEPKAE